MAFCVVGNFPIFFSWSMCMSLSPYQPSAFQVSDSTGFGSGGTSVAAQVISSSDNSCFDPTKNVSPDFFFSIDPPNQIVQCQSMRIWWDNGTVQGYVIHICIYLYLPLIKMSFKHPQLPWRNSWRSIIFHSREPDHKPLQRRNWFHMDTKPSWWYDLHSHRW